MAEIMCSIVESRIQKVKYIDYRPAGSIVTVISDDKMRQKWLEIVCDLVSPIKRSSYSMIPGFSYLCDHWTPQLRGLWIDLVRSKQVYDYANCSLFWETYVDPQLIRDLGKEPLGVEDLINTWLWSEYERRKFYICVNADATIEEQKSWCGKDKTVIGETLILHPKTYIDLNNIGLSLAELSQIRDPEIVVHPKFDEVLTKTNIFNTDVGGVI